MISFIVNDMYSSRSAGAIVKSVKALDGDAKVEVNMLLHSVEIHRTRAGRRALSEAIRSAGFTPEPLLAMALAESIALQRRSR